MKINEDYKVVSIDTCDPSKSTLKKQPGFEPQLNCINIKSKHVGTMTGGFTMPNESPRKLC